jgi:hypothetical protein
LAVAARAQTITDLRLVEIGEGCATFAFTAGGAFDRYYAEFGEAHDSLTVRSRNHSTTDSGLKSLPYCFGAPEETWYARVALENAGSPVYATCSGTCTNCGSGDAAIFADGSGLNCDGAGRPPTVTFAAATSGEPAAPVHAVTDPYDYTPATTLTASNCGDIASTIASAIAGDQATNIKVVVPASSCDVWALDLTGWTGSGRLWIEVADAATNLPAPGTRATPDYRFADWRPEPGNPQFEHRPSATSPVVNLNGASNVTLRGIHVRFAEPAAHRCWDIASVTTSGGFGDRGVVTLATNPTTAQLAEEDTVWFHVPGISGDMVGKVRRSPADEDVEHRLAMNWTGSYSGGGSLCVGHYVAISGASNTTPIRITTSAAHGLPNPANWVPAATGSNRSRPIVWIGGVGGNTAANGTWWYERVSATEIDLYSDAGRTTGVAGNGAYTSGGRMQIVRPTTAFLLNAANSTGVHILQSRISMPPRANYDQGANAVTATDSNGFIIRDSTLDWLASAYSTLPGAGNLNYERRGSNLGLGAVLLSGADDFQFVNNLCLECGFISLNAQNRNVGVNDWTVERNHFLRFRIKRDWSRPSQMAWDGGRIAAANDGRSTLFRHHIELKSGAYRVRIRNNIFEGNGPGINNGADILITNTRTDNTGTEFRAVRDIDVSHNIFRNCGQSMRVQTTTASANSDANRRSYFARIAFDSNVVSCSQVHHRDLPSNEDDTAWTSSTFAGSILTFSAPVEHIKVRNNSWVSQLGHGSAWDHQGHRSQFMVVTNNVFSYHVNPSVNWRGIWTSATGNSGALPWDNSSISSAWASMWPGTTFSANVIVGGIRNPDNWNSQRSSSDGGDTVTAAVAETDWGSMAAGASFPSGATYLDRLGAVFDAGSWRAKSPYAAAGVQRTVAEAMHAMGMPTNVELYTVGANLRVDYTAPSVAACRVTSSNDDFSTLDSAESDGGGAAARSVTIPSAARVRIECPGVPVEVRR